MSDILVRLRQLEALGLPPDQHAPFVLALTKLREAEQAAVNRVEYEFSEQLSALFADRRAKLAAVAQTFVEQTEPVLRQAVMQAALYGTEGEPDEKAP